MAMSVGPSFTSRDPPQDCGRTRDVRGKWRGEPGWICIAIPLYKIQVRPASLGGMENEIVDTTAESIEVEEELLVEEISIDGMCGVY